jgi:hypothetical protein
MGVLMDLVAGDAREILLAIGTDDWAGLRDPARFVAYVSLGRGMDFTWLDLFAQAIRESQGTSSPAAFSESTYAIESRLAGISERTIESVDPDWVDAVATTPGGQFDHIAARWIDLIEREECCVDPEDKPMLRELAGDLFEFCRRAEGAEDVLFAWSI